MTFQEYFKGKSKFEINKTREEMIREYEEYLFRQKHGPQDRPNVAQGGLIPAHQAGIYGLAEGGRIGFNAGSMLVAPTTDGSRPGYAYDDVEDMGFGDGPDMGSNSSSNSDVGDDGGVPDYESGPPTGGDSGGVPDFESGSAENTWATMSPEMAEKSKAETERVLGDHGDPMGNPEEQAKYARYVKHTVKKAPPKSSIGKTIGKGLLTLASFGLLGPAAAKMASYYKTGKTLHGFATKGTGKIGMFDVDFNNKTVGMLGRNVNLSNLINTKTGSTIDKDPSGLGYGKDLVKKPVIDHNDNNDNNDNNGPIITDGQTNIQTEGQKIALRRKQEQEWASYLAQLRQEELNRKKQAYLKNYRQSYMSAKGGRVPGYNTGGLSNLFKLKTA
jgi:hypothetical protein